MAGKFKLLLRDEISQRQTIADKYTKKYNKKTDITALSRQENTP